MADPNKVDPIHQFLITDIVPLGGGFSFTNSALFMVLVVALPNRLDTGRKHGVPSTPCSVRRQPGEAPLPFGCLERVMPAVAERSMSFQPD